jgi:perosamine synthetase
LNNNFGGKKLAMTPEKTVKKLEQIIKKVSNKKSLPISLHEPTFNGNELKYITDCIESGWVSSAGKYVELFAEKLAKFCQCQYAIPVVNGTAALHICLKLAGVKINHEVLCQAFTFVATANAISYCNATPHFIDIETNSLGICPQKLENYLDKISEIRNGNCFNKETGRKIQALVIMHTFGHPSQLDELKEVCQKFNLILIEDAAEAIGSYYKGKHVGNHGLLSALSFNGNKTITTGGGGAILTNSSLLAQKAKHLTTTGKLPHKWKYYHDCVAYNYRMPNLNAALGCAQLESLPSILKIKRELASTYQRELTAVPELTFLGEPEYAQSNYWLNAIILNKSLVSHKTSFLENLNTANILVRPAWNLLSNLPMYKNCPADKLNNSLDVFDKLINLPSSA